MCENRYYLLKLKSRENISCFVNDSSCSLGTLIIKEAIDVLGNWEDNGNRGKIKFPLTQFDSNGTKKYNDILSPYKYPIYLIIDSYSYIEDNCLLSVGILSNPKEDEVENMILNLQAVNFGKVEDTEIIDQIIKQPTKFCIEAYEKYYL